MMRSQKALLLLAFNTISFSQSLAKNLEVKPSKNLLEENHLAKEAPILVPKPSDNIPSENKTTFNIQKAEDAFKAVNDSFESSKQMESYHKIDITQTEISWIHSRKSGDKVFQLKACISFGQRKASFDLGPEIGHLEITITPDQMQAAAKVINSFVLEQTNESLTGLALEYKIQYNPEMQGTVTGIINGKSFTKPCTADSKVDVLPKILLQSYMFALTEYKTKLNPDIAKKENYAKAIKDLKKFTGCFNFYKRKDEILLELEEKDFNKIWTIIGKIHSSPFSEPLLSPGSDISLNIDPINHIPLVKWVKRKNDDERLFLMAPNTKYIWEKNDFNTNIAKQYIPEPVLAACPIEQIEPDKKLYLVNVTQLFAGELFRLSQLIELAGYNYSLDLTKSYLDHAVTNNDSASIRYQLHYSSGRGSSHATTVNSFYENERVEDNRSAPLKVTYTLAPYKEVNYRPRFAHKEVGYFTVSPLSVDRIDKKEHSKNFVIRHKLEKTEDNAPLSEVKDPIIFYLYNIPDKYKQSVKKGILNWNPLFEKIGYKNALVVKDAPTDPDWDHANGLQNVVRWGLESQMLAARALLEVDPFNGRIVGSTFNLNLSIPAGFDKGFKFFLSNPNESDKKKSNDLNKYKCCGDYWNDNHSILGLSNSILPKHIREQFIQQEIEGIVCHEVGHCLGLRHNFIAQTYYNIDQIKDEEFVKKNGLSSSIMSYDGLNVFALRKKKGILCQTKPGLYDYSAIDYGYKPLDTISVESEKPQLEKVVQQMRAKNLKYMTDSDFSVGDNPYISTNTLSAQPIEYAKEMYKLLKDIRVNIIKNFTSNGKKLSENTLYLAKTYELSFKYIIPVLSFVGGVESSRHQKAINLKSPIAKPISLKTQKEVLNLVLQLLEDFQENSWPKSVLFNLTLPYSPKPNSITPTPDIFKMWNNVSHLLISNLLSPIRIERILANQFRMKDSKEALKLDEYYSIIQSHVFANKPLTLMRKQLHRGYISDLIETVSGMQKPTFLWFTFNTEARIYAEKQLTKLQNQIKANSIKHTTEEEKDHYNDLLKQISAFLNRKTLNPVKLSMF